jgi:hypothetical protein
VASPDLVIKPKRIEHDDSFTGREWPLRSSACCCPPRTLLTDNTHDLRKRVHSGRYRPQPVRRVYVPKADGGNRPPGVPALEDKIVQSAVAEVLSAVYEVDFLRLSYSFRPGRNPHMALDALGRSKCEVG